MGYKEGYLFVFNQLSEIIERCKWIQAEAEEKVIDGGDAEIAWFPGIEPTDEPKVAFIDDGTPFRPGKDNDDV